MITINYRKIKMVLSKEDFKKFKLQSLEYQVYRYQRMIELGRISPTLKKGDNRA